MQQDQPDLSDFFETRKETNEGEKLLFEHYKLYVDSMEKLVARRQTAQSFFLTANVSLLTLTGFLVKGNDKWDLSLGLSLVGIAFSGILISCAWSRLQGSFFAMSSAKFQVIHTIEKRLPAKLFLAEEEALKGSKYTSMTKTEARVAHIFTFCYAVLGTVSLILIASPPC